MKFVLHYFKTKVTSYHCYPISMCMRIYLICFFITINILNTYAQNISWTDAFQIGTNKLFIPNTVVVDLPTSNDYLIGVFRKIPGSNSYIEVGYDTYIPGITVEIPFSDSTNYTADYHRENETLYTFIKDLGTSTTYGIEFDYYNNQNNYCKDIKEYYVVGIKATSWTWKQSCDSIKTPICLKDTFSLNLPNSSIAFINDIPLFEFKKIQLSSFDSDFNNNAVISFPSTSVTYVPATFTLETINEKSLFADYVNRYTNQLLCKDEIIKLDSSLTDLIVRNDINDHSYELSKEGSYIYQLEHLGFQCTLSDTVIIHSISCLGNTYSSSNLIINLASSSIDPLFIDNAEHVDVFDSNGKKVISLSQNERWNFVDSQGEELSAGLYFVSGHTQIETITIIK